MKTGTFPRSRPLHDRRIFPAMMNPPTDPRLLRLHADDNVLTVIAPFAVGDSVIIDGTTFPITVALPIGHKVAACAIPAGAKILKYGAPIGSATRSITPGEHVHTHNLQSDYLPTFLRENQHAFYAANHEHA